MTREERALRRSTPVEISLVIGLCTGLVGGSVWATKITMGQSELQGQIRDLKEIVTRASNGHWTRADMSLWVDRANREVELWSIDTERALDLESGTWRRFVFPDPISATR